MYAISETITIKNTTTTRPNVIASFNASSSRFSKPDNLLPYLLLLSPNRIATATEVCRAGVPESFATTTIWASSESFK